MESLSTQECNVAPGSPSDQALRDLATDQCPSQAPEDQLLGASQLQQELSDGSSSGEDENDNVDLEGLLGGLDDVEEEEVLQEDMVLSQEDEPMPPELAPYIGSHPPPQCALSPSLADIMDQEGGGRAGVPPTSRCSSRGAEIPQASALPRIPRCVQGLRGRGSRSGPQSFRKESIPRSSSVISSCLQTLPGSGG